MHAELDKYYPHQKIESRIAADWIQTKRYVRKSGTPKNFSMVVPPPNITGVLHLGHTLNATVQDVLARRARSKGYNVCWVPGSDHASIATEAKVMAMLKETKKLEKKDITREVFLQHAHEWKAKYGNIIYDQFQRLGCSMDWEKLTFTLDENYYQSVISAFVSLYKDGCIYQGKRMIHWDTIAQTALSDEEVEYRDVAAELYYLKYVSTEDASQYLLVATKRPETIMGDVAVCVHPQDKRYANWIGKQVIVPLVNRPVSVIADEAVDMEFGTGILKITPAHAPDDYEIAVRHNLPIIESFNLDGTISAQSNIAVGKKIDEAKTILIDMLKKTGLIERQQSYQTRIGYSQRTNAIVEPFISTQWFVDTKKIVQPAIEVVEKKEIKFYPEQRFENTYFHWMHNIKDWCISRQLWWGHRIPAWYDSQQHCIVAHNEEEAYTIYQQQFAKDKTIAALKTEQALRQDPDCLDTWFSSWLWPIEVFKGMSQKENNELKEACYPTSVLVTGHDILFFWVARMIMAGLYFEKKIPFYHVYFTGMVRDHQGRKMSKSLGNSPDLLGLIESYGADAVRFGVMIASPAGNDLLFDEASLTQGKNFNNKLWNAWKLLLTLQEKTDATLSISPLEHFANTWMQSTIVSLEKELEEDFAQYRLSEALKKIYSLLRNTFCNDYLEWIKPASDKKISAEQCKIILRLWRKCLQMLHPFLPFITEELFNQTIQLEDKKDAYVIEAEDASNLTVDDNVLKKGNEYVGLIMLIREAKQEHQIGKQDAWYLFFEPSKEDSILTMLLEKIVKCQHIQFTTDTPASSIALPYENWQIHLQFKASQYQQNEQIIKLKKELEHQQNLLISIEKKLNNQQFLSNAKPALIALEKKKCEDTKNRIAALEKHF